MSFVHTGLLIAGAGLAAIPLVIHLLSRRAYRNEPWAAMQFLLSAQQATRRRLRVEQWLLLALRMLIVALVGVTLARPFAASSSVIGSMGSAAGSRVIVIDDSLSMQARRDDGSTCFDAALVAARRLIDAAGPNDGLAIVLASAPPRRLIANCTRDHVAVREALATLRCSSRMNDLFGAVDVAGEILGRDHSVEGARACFVITDMTARSFVEADSGAATQPSAEVSSRRSIDRLVFMDVGPTGRGNLSLRALERVSEIVGVRKAVKFALELTNQSAVASGPVSIAIVSDANESKHITAESLEPWQSKRVEFETTFESTGLHQLAVRMENGRDALPEDDVQYLVVDVPAGLRCLGVQDQLHSLQGAGPLFYVQAALAGATSPDERNADRFNRCTGQSLPFEVLADYDVVFLGDLPRVSAEAGRRLREFIRSGGGVILIAADRVTPEGYAGHDAGPFSWMPVKLGAVQRVATSDRPLKFEMIGDAHPALRDFVDSPTGGLQRANVLAYRQIETKADSSVDVLLRFSDGAPALVQQRLGRGIVLCWMTSADMTWTNLPSKPDFVPLMLNLVRLAAAGAGREVNTRVGKDIVWVYPIPSSGREVRVLNPDGASQSITIQPADGVATVSIEEVEQPGFYRAGASEDRRLAAVNLDAADSDLSRASEDQVRSCFGPGARIIAESEIPAATKLMTPPREFAPILMIGLLSFLVIETIIGTLLGGVR